MNREKVKCQICGIEKINLQNHIIHFHNMCCSDYKLMFPKEKLHKGQKAWNKGIKITYRKKISKSVKQNWENGVYNNRKKMETHKLSKRIKKGLSESEKQKNKITFRPSFLSKEKQLERSKKLSKSLKKYFSTHNAYNKDKTIEELFGIEKANKIRNKIKEKRLQQIFPTKYTSIENAIYDKLLQLNLAGYFERNEIFGKYYHYDFVSKKFKIIIEADGNYWHSNPEIYNRNKLNKTQVYNQKNDKRKNKIIENSDYIILRFWESDINNDINNVGNTILNYCNRGGFSTNEI